ncbi:unnamed protein product [Prorocentrum cordatum]|uniref:HTH OST-type domain-containing protein n=1 Tax=Prorocentrum cordatum TaxID=2364126 RepID=A0ABN9RG57_9DINO|nr:unnamed protein product [Polarella glacialis]
MEFLGPRQFYKAMLGTRPALYPPKWGKWGERGRSGKRVRVQQDETSSDTEDGSDDPAAAVDLEEARRQRRREQAVWQAIRHLLSGQPRGLPLGELPGLLESVNVQNFSPERCGYSSLERFARGLPRDVLRYHAKEQVICLPR